MRLTASKPPLRHRHNTSSTRTTRFTIYTPCRVLSETFAVRRSEPVCNRQKVRCKPLDWRVMAFGSSLNGDTLPMLASMFAYLTGLKYDCRQALSAFRRLRYAPGS